MTTLQLREWHQERSLSLTVTQRDLLRTRFNAQVEPALGENGRYDVTPGNTVGAVVAGGTAIVVQPKIPIARVTFLLGYTTDPTWHDEDTAALADVPDIVTAMAAMFVRLTERALRRGLLTGYRAAAADLHTVRGRIDLAEQLRRRPGQLLPLAVEWQEFDEDTTENRMLLAAARLLQLLPLHRADVRGALRRITESLQQVTLVRYPPNAVPRPTWTRLNEHYRPAVEFAALLLRHASIDLAHGSTSTPALTFDMAVVFEEFVRTALRRALDASETQFPKGNAHPVPFDHAAKPVKLEPDLSYWPDGRCTFVGDVKYKRDGGHGHNPDLYQMLAYATALRLPQATLVYADGPQTAPAIRVIGSDTVIHLRHLDLALPPPELLAQIRALADRIRGDAPAASGSSRRVPAGGSG